MQNVRALLVSTYELGHQPFGLASPAAWLRRDGVEVRCVDLAKEKLPPDAFDGVGLIGFHLAMHTATRLAAPVIRKARAANPSARVVAYGLYAPLNADWLRSIGVDEIVGGEFEAELATIARGMCQPPSTQSKLSGGSGAYPVRVQASSDDKISAVSASSAVDRRTIPKLRFIQPDRSGLPPLSRYATVRLGDGTTRVAGYTEASRGCRHLCRHCPIVPVYEGQFRVVPLEVVMADVEAQVAAGARHITFGDPDFLNGPTHAARLVEALHRAHPDVSYDVTIKIQHLLQHRGLLPLLRDTGCLFITSAVEALDDRVLALLDKGHTRQDFLDAVGLCRAAGLNLSPTFVAFHPWTSLAGYCDLLDTIESLDLVSHVAPIQLAIRLLIPSGSRMLEVDAITPLVGDFDARTLTYRWTHPDPRVDALQAEVSALVGRRLTADRWELFEAISHLAHDRAGIPRPFIAAAGARAAVPSLDEPWYCCAEPNPEQLTLV
jgi:radical SAM superfamily enzyme YgiQ (UPF0313 family)